ncbi:MAG TPA: hypothetical protein VHQ00_05320 [Chloroflexota bacterium]|nr:hypothetical protein [Chloroflexota bacterium]
MRQMVFVAHQVAGVRLIPREWLDGFRPSGFREATAREIALWHEERGLELPADGALSGSPGAAPGAAPAVAPLLSPPGSLPG